MLITRREAIGVGMVTPGDPGNDVPLDVVRHRESAAATMHDGRGRFIPVVVSCVASAPRARASAEAVRETATESLVHVGRCAKALAPALSAAGVPADSLNVDAAAALVPEGGGTLRLRSLSLDVVVQGQGLPRARVESVVGDTVREWSLFSSLPRYVNVRIVSIQVKTPVEQTDKVGAASQELLKAAEDTTPTAVSTLPGESPGGAESAAQRARPPALAALLLVGLAIATFAALIGWRTGMFSGAAIAGDRPGAASPVEAPSAAVAAPTVGGAAPTPPPPVASAAPAVAVSASPLTGTPTEPIPPVVLGPSPTPAPLLQETFAAPSAGWPNDTQGPAVFMAGGGYRIIAREPGRFVAIDAPLPAPVRDVVTVGRFRKTGGPPGGGYGLIVRDQGPEPRDGSNQSGRFYVFEAGDKGEAGIWRRDVDHWVDLLPWTAAPAVHPGTAPNEISVQAIGARLAFFVNSIQISSLEDQTLSDGRVGVFVGGDFNEVTLDYFAVQVP